MLLKNKTETNSRASKQNDSEIVHGKRKPKVPSHLLRSVLSQRFRLRHDLSHLAAVRNGFRRSKRGSPRFNRRLRRRHSLNIAGWLRIRLRQNKTKESFRLVRLPPRVGFPHWIRLVNSVATSDSVSHIRQVGKNEGRTQRRHSRRHINRRQQRKKLRHPTSHGQSGRGFRHPHMSRFHKRFRLRLSTNPVPIGFSTFTYCRRPSFRLHSRQKNQQTLQGTSIERFNLQLQAVSLLKFSVCLRLVQLLVPAALRQRRGL